MYKVGIEKLEKIKKHLINVQKSLDVSNAEKQNNAKLIKENQKLIKMLEESYYI